ncbi:DUF362 domain-containing protein [Desulfuromonas carbonis]
MVTEHHTENKVGVSIRMSGSPAYPDVQELSGLIRDAIYAAGVGHKNRQAPFSELIGEGATVLLKPNWVLHENYGGHGMDCLVTHPNFILAVLAEVLKAKPGRVVIGDAPIQECHFETLVPPEWREMIVAKSDCPVDILDLRRTILRDGDLSLGQDQDVRSLERYVLFDLGKASLLEPVSDPDSRFRITCYDPDRLAEKHGPGRHQYLLAKEPFEADVIINLPKLKTHKKGGITAALKNLVGLNGNKEYLPHHRLGGSKEGGDCYPGTSQVKKMAEYCLDEANRRIGTAGCQKWLKSARYLLKAQNLLGNPEIEGGWHGNDTVWRMTLDLNRILLYGTIDGEMSDMQQRTIFSLTDAVIAGEGDGPLAPMPVPLGAVSFSSNSAFADWVHASLMGFDPRKIPMIREAFQRFPYPLTTRPPGDCQVICNGRSLAIDELRDIYGREFVPASGWQGHIEGRG